MKLTKSQKIIILLSGAWIIASLVLAGNISSDNYDKRFHVVEFLTTSLIMSSPVAVYWAGVWVWGIGYIIGAIKWLFKTLWRLRFAVAAIVAVLIILSVTIHYVNNGNRKVVDKIINSYDLARTAKIEKLRKKYPRYNDLGDQQLVDVIYKKFYSNMPRDQFDARLFSNNELLNLSSQTQTKKPWEMDWSQSQTKTQPHLLTDEEVLGSPTSSVKAPSPQGAESGKSKPATSNNAPSYPDDWVDLPSAPAKKSVVKSPTQLLHCIKMVEAKRPYSTIPAHIAITVSNSCNTSFSTIIVGWQDDMTSACTTNPRDYAGLKNFSVDLAPLDSAVLDGELSAAARHFCLLEAY